jgi:hypothetical protein
MTGASTRINLADWNTLRDFKLSGDDTQTFGISATATASRYKIDSVWINNVISGIGLNNTWIGQIDRCIISTTTNGIFVHDGLSSNGPVNAINITGGEIVSSTYGIRFAKNGGASFAVNAFNVYGMAIEPDGTYGVWVEDVGVGSLNFNGVYWEACGAACYQQDVGINSVNFDGGRMALDNNASTDKGIVITAGITDNVSIRGVEFNRGGSSTATDAVHFEVGATINAAYMQGNVKGNSNLVVVNAMTGAGTAITYIADDFAALGSKIPKIFSLGGGSRPNSAGNNFMNSTTIVNPATTSAVTFGTAEDDADYEITVFDLIQRGHNELPIHKRIPTVTGVNQ